MALLFDADELDELEDDPLDAWVPDESAIERDALAVMTEAELAKSIGWLHGAACTNLETDLFFPLRNALVGPRANSEDRRQLDVAAQKRNASGRDLCNRCPVRIECLSEAIFSSQVGVWGGHTRLGRTMLRERLQQTRSEVLRPACGTLDGFYRHTRDGSDVCIECRDAAISAGVPTASQSPARRAAGEFRVIPVSHQEELPDASPLVPVQVPLLVGID